MSPSETSERLRPASMTPIAASGTAARLLIIDDESAVAQTLARYLRARGYEVDTAADGMDGLERIRRGPQFRLAICDVKMPNLSGIDLVPQALAIDPDLAILMLSGMNDAATATEALGRGAMDYLLKPIELPDLERAIERALHRRALLIERHRVERIIREEVASRTAELERDHLVLRDLTVSIVETLINAMEAKDIYLRGHSQRIAELAASIAAELGLTEDDIEAVRMAGRIHDVGKIGIRESVLNKPSALTPEEFEHVKEHVLIGMEILAPLKHIGVALRFVQDHHEHWDGTGYPAGIAGADISIGGRILAAADAYDSITSHRAYREPLSPQETVTYLRDQVGTLLDPAVYDALATVILRRKSLVFSFIENT
jgi:putative two-component system response regulator